MCWVVWASIVTCPVLPLGLDHPDLLQLPSWGYRKSPLCFPGWTWLHSEPDGPRGDLTQMHGSWGRPWIQGLVEIYQEPVLFYLGFSAATPVAPPHLYLPFSILWHFADLSFLSSFYGSSGWELLPISALLISLTPQLFPPQCYPSLLCPAVYMHLIILEHVLTIFQSDFSGPEVDFSIASHVTSRYNPAASHGQKNEL